MIVTLTPNPSLDLLFNAGRLVWDDANRIEMPRRRVGGQGINVVRAVRALGAETRPVAIAPLGGPVGAELRATMEAEGTRLGVVPIQGETRVFVGVRERETGRALLLNPRGPEADGEVGERLLAAVDEALTGGDMSWAACCGSLLPGLPVDLYARVAAMARDHGVAFVPDCDGPALAAAVDEGASLLVPNAHEAGRLLGAAVDGVAGAARAARSLLPRVARAGSPWPARVVVTLGEKGAVAIEADDATVWWARPALPPELRQEVAGGSAVGAGDAFLAGFLLALEARAPLPEAVADAVAAGTAALLSRGGDLVQRADVERVRPHVEAEPVPQT